MELIGVRLSRSPRLALATVPTVAHFTVDDIETAVAQLVAHAG